MQESTNHWLKVVKVFTKFTFVYYYKRHEMLDYHHPSLENDIYDVSPLLVLPMINNSHNSLPINFIIVNLIFFIKSISSSPPFVWWKFIITYKKKKKEKKNDSKNNKGLTKTLFFLKIKTHKFKGIIYLRYFFYGC